jgi:two-component system, sensor histidine kinase and response regulator
MSVRNSGKKITPIPFTTSLAHHDTANKPNKILIVDDQPSNLRVLSSYLDELGFDILVARNGPKALEIAKVNEPDLILLDIMMPDMDGYETCIALKNEDKTRPIPIVFLSAREAVEDTIKGFELGAVDYVRKPFNFTELYVRLRTHLENKRMRDLLQFQATMDCVTTVPNRARYEQFLAENWKRASRSGSPLSIILIDIDHFKVYNDHYGHTLGDLCLKKVAQMLSECARRPSDLLARYGGEEFVGVLPDTPLAGGAAVAQFMLRAVQQANLEHLGSPLAPTVSISLGVASTIPTTEVAPEQLVKAADQKLYQAKANGRNRVVYEGEF